MKQRTNAAVALMIAATKHGGYIIQNSVTTDYHTEQRGLYNEPWFAGTLDDCLRFIKDNIAKFEEPEASDQ